MRTVLTGMLISEILIFAGLLTASGKRYESCMKHFSGGNKWLRFFIPPGLLFLEIIGHRYASPYERRLETKLRLLNGVRHSDADIRLHMASKVSLLSASSIFLTFVASQISPDWTYLAFCIVLTGLLFYAADRQLDAGIKERSRRIQTEFPKFLTKLILLVNAGLPVTGAIYRIVREGGADHPLFTELGAVLNEIDSGKSETQAFEGLARRCGLQEVTLFASAIIQNLRKGNEELIPVLRLMATSSWETRKNIARKLGEEASTKLLLPMTMVFLAILIMLITPAVFQLDFK